MTVAVLKTKLQELGLPTTGKKDELVNRYVESTAVDATGETEPKIDIPAAAPAVPETAKEDRTNTDAPSKAKIVFPVKEVSSMARSEPLSF